MNWVALIMSVLSFVVIVAMQTWIKISSDRYRKSVTRVIAGIMMTENLSADEKVDRVILFLEEINYD